MVVCPPQFQVPGVQISCAGVFDEPLSAPGNFDQALVGQGVPLEPTSDAWTFYPHDKIFERTYTFPDGDLFRVLYDAGEDASVNIAAYYTPK